MEGEKRRTPILLGRLDRVSLQVWARVGVFLFSPSILLKTEAEPASETYDFNIVIFLIF
jgi:hypothetical protein